MHSITISNRNDKCTISKVLAHLYKPVPGYPGTTRRYSVSGYVAYVTRRVPRTPFTETNNVSFTANRVSWYQGTRSYYINNWGYAKPGTGMSHTGTGYPEVQVPVHVPGVQALVGTGT